MQKKIQEKTSVRVPHINGLEQKIPLKTPWHLYIDPSGACNFKCTFCPCNMEKFRDKERHAIMSMDLFRKIVNDMKNFPDAIECVYLYAFGEPLLNPGFCDMVRLLKAMKVCNQVRTITNASLLNPELNQEIVDSGLDYIKISVEAMDSSGYRTVCDYDMNMQQYVANIHDLFQRSRGKMEIAIKIVNVALQGVEGAQQFLETFAVIADYAYIDNIRDIWAESENLTLHQENEWKKENNYYEEQGGSICAMPFYSMVIHSDGDVSACCQDWKFATSYGNVKQESLSKIWDSQRLREFRIMHLEKSRENIEFCKGCHLRSFANIDPFSRELLGRLKDGV